jgi:phosphomethylpyrimidine synthase
MKITEWSRWEAGDMDHKAKGRASRGTSQHKRANGRGWVDNQKDCPELRGPAALVKITEDVRKYATEQGLAEAEVLESGMQEKRKEFANQGSELYPKV